MKKVILGSLIVLAPITSYADTGAGCGWGEMVWEGKTGFFAHTSAGTTNATFFNQVFGMISGTAGCDTSQTIEAASLFMDNNMEKVALDFSRGKGENLDALGKIFNISETEEFSTFVQSNFSEIYPSSEVSAEDMMESLVALMKSDGQFSKYVS